MKRMIKYVAFAARWLDKPNGNTYHSVRITRCKDGKQLVCAMQYGYGDSYKQTALEAMAAARWLPVKYRAKDGFNSAWYSYELENGYPIDWNVSDGSKRNCERNGKGGLI